MRPEPGHIAIPWICFKTPFWALDNRQIIDEKSHWYLGIVICKKGLQHGSSFCSCRSLVSPFNAAADFHTASNPTVAQEANCQSLFCGRNQTTSNNYHPNRGPGVDYAFQKKISKIRQVWGQASKPCMVGALASKLKALAFCFPRLIVKAVADHRPGKKISDGRDLETPHNHMSPQLTLRTKTRASVAAAIATRVLYAGPPSRTTLDWKAKKRSWSFCKRGGNFPVLVIQTF